MTHQFQSYSNGISISIEECRVLVVDDNERSWQLIGSILNAAGINNLEYACDGVDGLEKVESYRPDIIILDIMMPNMDGFEFMRHMRTSTDMGTVPILVQTSLNSNEERNDIYAAGATDMLTKPLSPGQLITRVRTHLENRCLTQIHQNQLRLEAELNAAQRMQEALLPPPSLFQQIRQRTALIIDGHFETSSELGGDMWGLHALGDNQTGIFTIDFSGHGLGASLNTFRLHTIMSNLHPTAGDPAEYLSVLNNQLKQLLPLGQYATMFYGIIDTQLDTLTYSAAGAPFPLIGHLDESEAEYHDASGVPLGMKHGVTYENRRIDFPTGSYLFLYSDALIETPGYDGKDMDEPGVKDLLKKSLSGEDAHSALKDLRDRFHNWTAIPPLDDLTLVLAIRGEEPQPGPLEK